MAEDDPDLKADLKAWREWNEKPVPLSAIRALVQQWREEAVSLQSMSDEYITKGNFEIARAWHTEAEITTLHADQLAAMCDRA